MIRPSNIFTNRIFISLLLIIACQFSIQIAMAQAPVIRSSVDKKDILIGEQLNLDVEATFPSGKFVVSWLNIPDSTDHMEVVSRGKIDTVENNGIITFKQVITLTSFDSGKQTIPQFPINFDPLQDDSTLNLLTDSFRINVGYSPLDSVKTFHDIKPILNVKYEWPLWYYLAAADALLLLIVLILLAIRLLKKKKKPVGIFDSNLSAYEEAVKSLTSLQTDQLLMKGEAKQYHVKLTDIFKRYLSRKLQADISNLTSSEILMKLDEMRVNKGNVSIMANNLRLSDAVKFAKYQPPIADSEDALINTKRVIEQMEAFLNLQSTDIK